MDFDQAIERVLGIEGGYVNNPADPGGETNWGISKRSYPDVDIASLTRNGAKAIYLRDFWEPLGDLNPAVKYQALDFGVNSGIQTAIRKLQTAIGVADDGHWGPVSAAKAASMNLNDILMRFAAQRLLFMASLSTWPSFGRGWARRVAADLMYASDDNG